jgi:hypothetical protein
MSRRRVSGWTWTGCRRHKPAPRIRPRKTLNKALLLRTARRLRRLRHEEHYRQDTWGLRTACGTTACVAGHLILASGRRLLHLDKGAGSPGLSACVMSGRTEIGVAEAATKLAGIPRDTYGILLFAADATSRWPEPYRDRLLKGERPSRVAADYLEAIAAGQVKP